MRYMYTFSGHLTVPDIYHQTIIISYQLPYRHVPGGIVYGTGVVLTISTADFLSLTSSPSKWAFLCFSISSSRRRTETCLFPWRHRENEENNTTKAYSHRTCTVKKEHSSKQASEPVDNTNSISKDSCNCLQRVSACVHACVRPTFQANRDERLFLGLSSNL